MIKLSFVAAAAATLLASSGSLAQSLPLNTGYNYTNFNTYPLPAGSPVRDNYWIEVAASAAPVPEPAFVVPNAPWLPPMTLGATGSRWISGTATKASYPGTSPINPSFSIFRKCFCLMPGFKTPQLSFRLRSDNSVQVYLNSQMNMLLTPSPANFSGGPVHSGGTSVPSRFRVGRNCIYVLVEDTGTITGFNLVGNVSALGLMPTAAAGTGMSFAPCTCKTPGPGLALSAAAQSSAQARGSDAEDSTEDDTEVIAALVKIAEDQRRAKPRP